MHIYVLQFITKSHSKSQPCDLVLRQLCGFAAGVHMRSKANSEKVRPVCNLNVAVNRIRVLRSRIKPDETRVAHAHPHRIIVVLEGAKLKLTWPSGRVKSIVVKRGDVIRSQAGESHTIKNVGETEYSGIVIELLSPRRLEPDRVQTSAYRSK